jgi:hypothetical protein
MCRRCAWRSRVGWSVDGTRGSRVVARFFERRSTRFTSERAALTPVQTAIFSDGVPSPFILPYFHSLLRLAALRIGLVAGCVRAS